MSGENKRAGSGKRVETQGLVGCGAGVVLTQDQPDPFAKLPALAARLGVA